MADKDKVWVPYEWRKKSVVQFKLPKLNIPVTNKDIIFFLIGVPVGYVIGLLILKVIHDYIVATVFTIAIPIFFAFFGRRDFNGKHPEEVLMSKIKYRRSANIILNEKAVSAIKDTKEGK